MDKMNEDLGRDSADNVLVVVGARLERNLRSPHGLVARYDGGRIGVVMPRTTRAEAIRACEQARLAIHDDPIRLFTAQFGAPSTVSANVSVGLAVIDASTHASFEDAAALLTIVEQAVRAANKVGGNTIRVYAPALTRAIAAAA